MSSWKTSTSFDHLKLLSFIKGKRFLYHLTQAYGLDRIDHTRHVGFGLNFQSYPLHSAQLPPHNPKPPIESQLQVDIQRAMDPVVPESEAHTATSPKAIVGQGSSDDFSLLLSLPAELRVRTMMLLPDPPTLQRLLWASDTCKATFKLHAVQILNVLISCYTLEMRQVMHAVAMRLTGIRTARLFEGDGSDLFHNQRFDPRKDILHEMFGCTTLPSTLGFTAARRFLLVACLVHQTANEFLDFHLDYLNRIEYGHDLDESCCFDWDAPYQAGTPLISRKNGPVSWAERYRVEITIWRVIMESDFHAGREWLPSVDDEKDPVAIPMVADKNKMWSNLSTLEEEQMDDLIAYVIRNNKGIMTIDFEDLSEDLRSSDGKFVFAKSNSGVILDHPFMDNPPSDKVARAWEQDRLAARLPTSPCQFANGDAFDDQWRERRDIDIWDCFRRIGFGFWDLKRLFELELFSNSCCPLSDPGDDGPRLREGVGSRIVTQDQAVFAWMSVTLEGRVLAEDKYDLQ